MDNYKIQYKINTLEYKVHSIEQTLIELERKINIIQTNIEENIEPSCNKMNKHITFLDSIYNTAKSPIDYIVNTFNK